MAVENLIMTLEFPQPVPRKACSSHLYYNRSKNVCSLCCYVQKNSQMAGMFWTNLATLGAVIFQGFGLVTIHPGCGSVPAGFLTFLKRVLTPSSSASSTKLEESLIPSAMIVFALSLPD